MHTVISSFNLKSLVFVTVLLNTLILSACGGGGGSSSDNATVSLNTPTIINVDSGDGEATVNWSSVSGADTYTVYVNDGTYASSSSFIKSASTSTLSSTITGLVNSQVHTVVVIASNATSGSNPSEPIQFTPLGLLPSPVTDLTVISNNSSVTTSWTATENATSYEVIYSMSADFLTTDGWINTTGTSYDFSWLTNGVTYYFKIRAKNDTGLSEYSAAVSVAPDLQQGWNLKDYISINDTDVDVFSNSVTMNSSRDVLASWTYIARFGSASGASVYASTYTKSTGWETTEISSPNASGSVSDLSENGDGIIAWEGLNDIQARHYQAGVWGDSVILSGDESGGSPSFVDIKIDYNGNALAAWQGDDGYIYAKSYDKTTDTWSAVTKVSTVATYYVVKPQIGVDDTGVFVVFWEEKNSTYNMSQIYTRKYSKVSGWEAAVLINNDPPADEAYNYDASLAACKNGDIFAAWVHTPTAGSPQLLMRKYTATIDSWGPDITVDAINGFIEAVAIKADANSNAIINWSKRVNDGVSLESIDSLNAAVYNDSKGTFGPALEMLVSEYDIRSFDTLAAGGNNFSIFYSVLPEYLNANQRIYDFNTEIWSAPTVIYENFAISDYAVTSNSVGEIVLSGTDPELDYSSGDITQYIMTTFYLP